MLEELGVATELLLCSILEELGVATELLLCSTPDELGISATELELGCCGSSLPPLEEQEQMKARDIEIRSFLSIV